MDDSARKQMMSDYKVPEEHRAKLDAAAAALNIDFATILQVFLKYGATVFQILIDLGVIKPNPTPTPGA